jgi:hypothetical protein
MSQLRFSQGYLLIPLISLISIIYHLMLLGVLQEMVEFLLGILVMAELALMLMALDS